MSFDHKAYEFDWNSFSGELAPILSSSLSSNDLSALEEFITDNLQICSSPYDGEPLSELWKNALESNSVQELADFALTKYYRPTDDFGLGNLWLEISSDLPTQLQSALLGQSFGPKENLFDPGFQGSYFQSPLATARSANELFVSSEPYIVAFAGHLRKIATHGKGIYVTF